MKSVIDIATEILIEHHETGRLSFSLEIPDAPPMPEIGYSIGPNREEVEEVVRDNIPGLETDLAITELGFLEPAKTLLKAILRQLTQLL